jgi:hypothetical protein
LAKIPQPKVVNGIKQDPIEGKSLAYTFSQPNAKETHTTQYFEMFGNRGIYHEGWFARTIHRPAWSQKPKTTLQNDTWELYNTKEDFSLSKDLSSAQPEMLKTLQALFMKEAEKYHVLPIDDRLLERTNAALMGRPTVMGDRKSVTYGEGMKGMGVDIFIDLRNVSYSIDADVTVAENGKGVIVAQGGRFGGLSFYLQDGKPMFSYNYLGLQSFHVAGDKPLSPGKYQLRYEFAYDGGGMGKGGTGTIFVNGQKYAEARIGRTQAGIFSVDDLADIGMDEGTPVGSYPVPFKFKGKIDKVKIDVKK